MSILLRPNVLVAEAVPITTAASVAVWRAIKKVTGKETGIKWVNDIYYEGKKICGILMPFGHGSVQYEHPVHFICLTLRIMPRTSLAADNSSLLSGTKFCIVFILSFIISIFPIPDSTIITSGYDAAYLRAYEAKLPPPSRSKT